jgi:hypothetical protein
MGAAQSALRGASPPHHLPVFRHPLPAHAQYVHPQQTKATGDRLADQGYGLIALWLVAPLAVAAHELCHLAIGLLLRCTTWPMAQTEAAGELTITIRA